MNDEIERKLDEELRTTYREAGKQGYRATYFLQMLQQYGGRETSQRLLVSGQTQTGLFELYELDLISISVEAIVLKPAYRCLFEEAELKEAERRLDQLGFKVSDDGVCERKDRREKP